MNVVNINNVDNSESSKLISPCQTFFDDCDGTANCAALLVSRGDFLETYLKRDSYLEMLADCGQASLKTKGSKLWLNSKEST